MPLIALALSGLLMAMPPSDMETLMIDAIAAPSENSGVLLYQEISQSIARGGNADAFSLGLINSLESDARFANGTANQREATYILARLLTRSDVSPGTKEGVAAQLFTEFPTVDNPGKLLVGILPGLLQVTEPEVRGVLEAGLHEMLTNQVSERSVFAKCFEMMAEDHFFTPELHLLAVDILELDPSVEGLIEAINEGDNAELHPRLLYALILYALAGEDWDSALPTLKNSPSWTANRLASATALVRALGLHHPDNADSAVAPTSPWDSQQEAMFNQWLGEFTSLIQAADPADLLAEPRIGYGRYAHANTMVWMINKLDPVPTGVQTAFAASVEFFVEQEAIAEQAGLSGIGPNNRALIRQKIDMFTPDAHRALLPDNF